MWKKFKNLPLDNPIKTLIITIVLSIVSSSFITTFSVILKERQVQNAINDKRKVIASVAGFSNSNKSLDEIYENIEAKVLDLRSNSITNKIDVGFDEISYAKDKETSITLNKEDDIASIGRQSLYKNIYLIKNNGEYEKMLLPIHGYGAWSTLYGFISVDKDGNTIDGLRFYEHKETPGLGGEVSNPIWFNKWKGKKIYDENGNVRISVLKKPDSQYNVEAISGASLTSSGVHRLIQFWLSEKGYKEIIGKFSRGEIE